MSGWTDERIEACRKLWFGGYSSGQIANELGGITRNAVIGIVHRKGWKRRVKEGRGAEGGAVRKKPRKPRPLVSESFSTAPVIEGDLLEHIEVPTGPQISIMELNDKTCRWPIGEGPVMYCGALPRDKAVYCPYHCRVAYSSIAERRKESEEHRRSERAAQRGNWASFA
jgi:GcrA cell cycle regulator